MAEAMKPIASMLVRSFNGHHYQELYPVVKLINDCLSDNQKSITLWLYMHYGYNL